MTAAGDLINTDLDQSFEWLIDYSDLGWANCLLSDARLAASACGETVCRHFDVLAEASA